MTYATIHLHMTPYPAPTSTGAINYACAMAKLFEATLSVSSTHLSVRAPPNWFIGAMMTSMAKELEVTTTAATAALELHLAQQVAASGISLELLAVSERWPSQLIDNAWRGRVADACVLGLSRDTTEPRLKVEDWLFGAGRPCFLYPDCCVQPFATETVLICWDFSRSAARTVADALPLLHNTKRVRIGIFRGEKNIPVKDAAQPLTTFLANHGIPSETDEIKLGDRTVGTAILDHARSIDANLIAMGAFGHSRLQEFILGGATKELLDKSTLPLLMSH